MNKYLILVLLSGCSPFVGEHVEADCLHFYSQNVFDLDELRRNAALARKILTTTKVLDLRYGIYYPIETTFIPEERFCTVFANTAIIIRPETDWVCPHNNVCVGSAWDSGDVDVSYTTNALVHELIHQWDRWRGVSKSDNFDHVNWAGSGRYTMDQTYVDQYEPLSR